MKKRCTKCNIEKDETEFCKDKRALSGLQSSCKACQANFRKEKYNDLEYRKKILNRGKKYKEKNKKELAKKRIIYSYKNHKKVLEQRRKYRLKNKDKINAKGREYQMKRRQKDSLYKLKGDIRSLIGLSFRKNGFTKKCKTEQILGCSFDEFKIHLEKQFESWMTWENRGLFNGEFDYGWDIDHIIPLATAKTEEDIFKLNHHTNLRPLCCIKNRGLNKRKYSF